MKRLVSSLLIAVLVVAAAAVSIAACGQTTAPDARIPTPPIYDAAVSTPDAKPPTPDAGAPDAT